MTRIRVSCIQSTDEARLALLRGADRLGLVASVPSGPGPIPEARIAEIAATVEGCVLVTAATLSSELVPLVARCGVRAVQLVERAAPREIAALRAAHPGLEVTATVHVNGPSARDAALDMAAHADALLLDSGSPHREVRALGGTGSTHDWRISAEIVRESPVPVWLAGGLTPMNVGVAIGTVRPHGVDVCTGLRRGSALDRDLLSLFVAEVRACTAPT